MEKVAGGIVFLAGAVIVGACLVADGNLTAAAKSTAWLFPWYLLGGLISFLRMVLLLAGFFLDRDAR